MADAPVLGGTKTHPLDPEVFEPALAANLTAAFY